MFTFTASNDFIRVPIPLINDSIYELTETFTAGLSFTSDVPPRTTISPNSATITIIDDESMFKKSIIGFNLSFISSSLVLEFGFDPATYSYSESDGSASGLTVVSTGDNIGEFSIQIFAGTDDVNALATALGMKC